MRALAVDEVELVVGLLLVGPLRFGRQLAGAERVGALLLGRAGKGAEPALHAADVGLVEGQVADEEDLVSAAAQPPRAVGQLS